jgi:KaiC/GvpD/RAD55 family RecA-like ATPase
MSVFLGGSAYNMVRELADGFIIVTERTFKNYKPQDLTDFQMDAERYLREIRAAMAPAGDQEAIQKRQRRLQRLQQAITVANAVRSRNR